ncbi:MAG: hypothetical protein ACRDBO_16415 [Lachnospiraceae bacterium]
MKNNDTNEIRMDMEETEKMLAELENDPLMKRDKKTVEIRKEYNVFKTDMVKSTAYIQGIWNQFIDMINRLEKSGLGFVPGELKDRIKDIQQDLNDMDDILK